MASQLKGPQLEAVTGSESMIHSVLCYHPVIKTFNAENV
jgi:hypothetical protein